MIQAQFLDSPLLVFFKMTIAQGDAVQTHAVLLDTGFSGDLKVTEEMAQELRLLTEGVEEVQVGHGINIPFQTATTRVDMEGVVKEVVAIISGGFPAAGMGLLTKFGYRATIDCKEKTAILERS